jgi:hypothetical protein
MFTIADSPSFWTKVRLSQTAEDGRKNEGQIECQFKRRGRTELTGLLESLKGEKVTVEMVEEHLVGWKGVKDPQGDMPYTPENLRKLCELVPSTPIAMIKAYLDASAGAREGN